MTRLRILLGLIAFAVIIHLLAVKYNLEDGSSLALILAKLKASLSVVRNFAHRSAEVFCNEPEECKIVVDQFLGVVCDISENLVERLMELSSRILNAKKSDGDGGNVKKIRTKQRKVP